MSSVTPICCTFAPNHSITPPPGPVGVTLLPLALLQLPGAEVEPAPYQPATSGTPEKVVRLTTMKACAGRSVDPQPPPPCSPLTSAHTKLPGDACATVAPDHAPASPVFHGS